MESLQLHRYMNHIVTITLSEGKAAELKLDEPRISGKVTNVSPRGLVLAAKSSATIIMADDILEVRLKRDRVITRMVRVFGPQDDVRQHLADRHGTFVSLLRSLSHEIALSYHNKIDHRDLGHQHGERPGTRAVNETEARFAMRQLDELE